MSYEVIHSVSPANAENFLSSLSSIIAEKTGGEAGQVTTEGTTTQVVISYPSKGGYDLVLRRIDESSLHQFACGFTNSDGESTSYTLWQISTTGSISDSSETDIIIAKSKNSFSIAFNGGFTSSYLIGNFFTIAENDNNEFIALSVDSSGRRFAELRSHGKGFVHTSCNPAYSQELSTSLVRLPDIYGGAMFNDLYIVFSTPLTYSSAGVKLQIENNIFLLLNSLTNSTTTFALKISESN